MLKLLAQALGPSTAATPGDSQANCRALKKYVGAPTRFTREVRCVNSRCAKCSKDFIFSTIRGTPSREVGPASPKAGFRANCRRPPLTTDA